MRRFAAIAAVICLGVAQSALAGGNVQLSGVVYTFNCGFPVASCRILASTSPSVRPILKRFSLPLLSLDFRFEIRA